MNRIEYFTAGMLVSVMTLAGTTARAEPTHVEAINFITAKTAMHGPAGREIAVGVNYW